MNTAQAWKKNENGNIKQFNTIEMGKKKIFI
jgi:hypothetical protein